MNPGKTKAFSRVSWHQYSDLEKIALGVVTDEYDLAVMVTIESTRDAHMSALVKIWSAVRLWGKADGAVTRLADNAIHAVRGKVSLLFIVIYSMFLFVSIESEWPSVTLHEWQIKAATNQ